MLYAKITNAEVTSIGKLPKIFKTNKGANISNFNLMSDSEVKAYGFLPVVDTTPAFVAAYNTLSLPAYTIEADQVTLLYTVTQKDILEYKQEKIAAAYQAANNQLDTLVQGYSQLEVATWPMIQADVLAFETTGVIGSYMQAAIDTSGYSAQGLADLLLPRFAEQATILAARKTAVEAIMLAGTHSEV